MGPTDPTEQNAFRASISVMKHALTFLGLKGTVRVADAHSRLLATRLAHTRHRQHGQGKTDNTVCNDSAPSVQTEAACPVRVGLQVGCSPAAWPKWTPWSPRRGKWSSNSCL